MIEIENQVVGRYQVLEQVGGHNLSNVYRAYDPRSASEVALKVFDIDSPGDAGFQKRFTDETRTLISLSHPNLIEIVDAGIEGSYPYLVMPYVDFPTLADQEGRVFAFQDAARILSPVARAVEYAHNHNILHGDIKPSSIFISRNGQPILAGFGISQARVIRSQSVAFWGLREQYSSQYLAPEQTMGKIAYQSDSYALGVIFFELVTGRKPYEASTPEELMVAMAYEPLPKARLYNPNLPDGIEWLIFKALARNPAERFDRVGALASALEKASDPKRIASVVKDLKIPNKKQTPQNQPPQNKIKPIAIKQKISQPMLIIIIAVAVLIVVVGLIVLLFSLGVFDKLIAQIDKEVFPYLAQTTLLQPLS